MKRVDYYLNCWWKIDNDFVIVYTEDLKVVKKIEQKPMAKYMKRDLKIFGYQFKVEINGRDYKKLFKEFELTDKDIYKVKRQKAEVQSGKNIVKRNKKKKGD